MPIALAGIAVFLILSGIRGNLSAVGSQFNQDVVGPSGFVSFLLGIFGIAVFFRLLGLPSVGRVFLALVVVVYLLENANLLTVLQNVAAGTTGTTTSATATG